MIESVHVIGNGKSASFFDHNSKGLRITCNLPPMAVENVYATILVDFKMMRAIAEGSVTVPGMWVCGYRPSIYVNDNPSFKMKYARQIRENYLALPKYVNGYTEFNCGHVATHYAASKFKPKEIHMYGFNSMFDADVSSCTDFYLESDRREFNNYRLTNNWRRIWPQVFAEFPDTNFILHNKHDKIKFSVPKNVSIITH